MKRHIAIASVIVVVLGALASTANAVSDRNVTERGQMPPYVDTPHPASHVNAMMQERYAAAGGPVDRVVVAFAEDIVKTRPLLPGASVRGAPAVLPSGNLIIGSGRGIGHSSLSLHDSVTGAILWAAPAYLGPSDYVSARTVGPGAYLQPQPTALSDGNIYLTDGYNLFSFVAETGALNWVTPHSSVPPGPQREREETSSPQSLEGDMSVGLSVAPKGILSPTGGWLVGGVYSRGSINYFDTTNGDPVIVKSAESPNRSPSCLATDAGSNPVACPSFGYDAPLIFSVLRFLCFSGGEISSEIEDWCAGLSFTHYFSVNGTMVDPLRNRIVFTYAGTGGTVADGTNTGLFSEDFDLYKVWQFVTTNGPGEDGTILTADTDGDGFGDTGLEELWLAEIGLNSAATPTLSESFEFLYGVDGAGTAFKLDANASGGQVLASTAGAGVWSSPSADHNDSLVICSSETGIARVSPDTGDLIWQNTATNLGLDRLTVIPSAPLVASGRPSEACTGFPSTHIDVHEAQFVVGYPVVLMDSLRSLGLPLSSSLTSMATVDVQVDARTGERVNALLRSFYRGSGEANIVALDSGRFVSARTDSMAAIATGLLNLVLPRRFDVPPIEGGFVIAEPLSFREAVLNQFQGAQRYCEEVLLGVTIPDQDGDGAPEEISDGLPIVVAGAVPAEQAERARELQLAVNKVGYINSIMKSSLPGRMDIAVSRAEIGALEAAELGTNIAGIVSATTVARDLLLGSAADRKDPATNPDESTQNQASVGIRAACQLVDWSIDLLKGVVCADDADCDDGNDCTSESCVDISGTGETFCSSQNEPAGRSCDLSSTCDGSGICEAGGGIVSDLDVTTFISGLEKPWDIAWLPNGTALVTERPGRLNVYVDGAAATPFTVAPADLVANGEGGMLGLEVDPDFANNGYVYVCMASNAGGATDVRLVRFTLARPNGDQVLSRSDIVTGMPYSTGRHSGCRPRFGPDGYLWVGTGDAAIGSTPQDDNSLGGKVLRVDRNGAPAADNPGGYRWVSKGHRNVQGMAFRSADNLGLSAEHGPSVDDEINLLVAGNFGWDPIPGYNESVPMTDLAKYPSAVEAVWSSGSPTLALSGAGFIEGSAWGDWNGALAVATLKTRHLHIYFVSSEGEVTGDFRVIEDRGRLRSPRQGPDGLLYITNDGSSGSGEVLQVSPVLSAAP